MSANLRPFLLFLTVLACPALPAQCDIFPTSLSAYSCNDNGTPGDPNDDTFTFTIVMDGIDIGADYQYNNPFISGTATYGTPVTLGPFPIAGTPYLLGFRDVDNPNCTYTMNLDPGPGCSQPSCALNAQFVNYQCDDGGTDTDPFDDTFTVDLSVQGLGTVSAGWNATGFATASGGYPGLVTLGPFTVQTGVTGVQVTDDGNSTCRDFATVFSPGSCSNGCNITTVFPFSVLCNDNGTPADPSDDFIDVNLLASGANVGSGYTVTSNAGTVGNGTGNYDVVNTISLFNTLPATTFTLTITDNDDPSCQATLDITAPPGCATPTCEITSVNLTTPSCFTNGTGTPDDDVYTLLVTVEGNNTGSGWTANDPFSTFGDYGAPELLGPYLIADGPLTVTFTDNDNPGCTAAVVITPPPPCSVPACNISANASNIICDDNGTPGNPNDDTFFFDIFVTGTDTGPGWAITAIGIFQEDYNQTFTLGPFPISGGDLNFTVADSDDPTCTSSISVPAPAPCSVPSCSINATVSNVTCNDNGTPNDPDDDTFSFDIIATGNGTGFNYTIPELGGTVLPYDQTASFGNVPLPNGVFTITLIDNANASCTATVTISVPTPCSIPVCDISASAGTIICDDNGTPTDPNDDTFTFELTVSGTNTSSGWSGNDPNFSNGAYGTATVLGPFLITSGGFSFTVTDNDNPGCGSNTISIVPPAPCSTPPPCDIIATATNVVCDDNGTPGNTADDTFTFELTVSGNNTGSGWSSDDPNFSSGAYGTATVLGPFLIASGGFSFTVTDNDNPGCGSNTISIVPPAPCSTPPPCDIIATATNVVCDDNGTPGNTADDTFTFELTVSGTNTGSGWSGNDPNFSNGTYGTATVLGPFLISSGGFSFTVTDNDNPGCVSNTVSIVPPAPCSTPPPCDIIATAANVVCDDNGTPGNTADDTFTFELTVSGTNTGSGWSSDDPNFSNGAYGTATVLGPFLIADGGFSFTVTDNDNPGCVSNTVSIVPPAPCSSPPPCDIIATATNVVCDDNSTPADPSDDTFTFELTVSGTNTGSGWSSDDPNFSNGAYGTATVLGPFLITSGSFSFTVTDNDNPGCVSNTVSIVPPAPCSTPPPCDISATVANVVCDDNGTPADPSDDTFTFELTVSGTNTGSGWSGDDPNLSSGAYGTATVLGPFLIADGGFSFTVTDNDNPGCVSNTVSIVPPAPCSTPPPCDISATAANVVCDDNGTPADPSDDTFTFELTVTGTNTGSGWSGDDPNLSSGAYGTATVLGPFLIADGGFSFTVTDNDNPGCVSNTVSIVPPAPCSTPPPCDIIATAANVVCDDNGTPADPSDDTFTFELTVSGTNTGSGWSSDDPNLSSGAYGTATVLGPFLIADGDITLTVTDDASPACFTTVTAPAPPPCSTCSQTVDAGTAGAITCSEPERPLLATSSALNGIFRWTGPNGFEAPDTLETSVNTPGIYVFTADFPDGCSFVDSVIVAIDTLRPEASAGPDTSLNCLVEMVELRGIASAGTSGQWTNGDGDILGSDNVLNVTAPGNYFWQVTSLDNGCSSSREEVIVSIDTLPPTAIILANPDGFLDCNTTSLVLSTPPQPGTVYTWDGASNQVVATNLTVNVAAAYVLTALDTLTGCTAQDSILINDSEEYPFIQITPPEELNCRQESITLDASGSQAGPTIEYTWLDQEFSPIAGATAPQLTVTTPGTYFLRLRDLANGCENIDTVTVDQNRLFPDITLAESIVLPCAEETTQLAAFLDLDITDVRLSWSSQTGEIIEGSTTLRPLVNGIGTYLLAVEDLRTGCISFDSTLVESDTDVPTVISLSITPERCENEDNGSATVLAVSGGSGPYQYTLNGQSSGTGFFTGLAPNDYVLQVTDDNGCTLDTMLNIAPALPLEVSLPLSLALDENQIGRLTAISSVAEQDLALIQWAPANAVTCSNCLETSVLALATQELQLTVTDSSGCIATATTQLVVTPLPDVYVPNAFSPNNDGQNDLFTLYANERVAEIEFALIASRWGEIVFERENFAPNLPELGWDGTFQEQPMNAGVFVYFFRVRMEDGTVQTFKGDITLVR